MLTINQTLYDNDDAMAMLGRDMLDQYVGLAKQFGEEPRELTGWAGYAQNALLSSGVIMTSGDTIECQNCGESTGIGDICPSCGLVDDPVSRAAADAIEELIEELDRWAEVQVVYLLGCPGDVYYVIYVRGPSLPSEHWKKVAESGMSYGTSLKQFDTWTRCDHVMTGPVVELAEENSTSYTDGMLFGALNGRKIPARNNTQTGRIQVYQGADKAKTLLRGKLTERPEWL